MAKKKKGGKKGVNKERFNLLKNIGNETKQGVKAVIFFAIAVFFILASLRSAGIVGEYTYNILEGLLGVGYFIVPILFFTLGTSYLKPHDEEKNFGKTKLFGSFLFFLSGLGIVDLLSSKGGIIGNALSGLSVKLFDFYASLIVFLALFAISLLILFEAKLSFESFLFWRRSKKDDDYDDGIELEDLEEEEYEEDDEEEAEEEPAKNKAGGIFGFGKKETALNEDEMDIVKFPHQEEYLAPPLSLLNRDSGKPGVGDIKANANIIKRTLRNFGIDVEMDEISIGPSVTRYALKPAEGVKLSRIVGLQNDLALALAAHPIRIEAPIPGKSLVGIEIPNSTRSTVGLASLISSKEYSGSPKPLLMALGRGISGFPEFADLGKMPHLLIAGSTGSGKSVTIHTLINSLIYRNAPENMRFIMVDPKRVELTLYNGIPHLLSPVITGAKKAIMALKWAAKEMERRYDILQEKKVRDIQSYHANIVKPLISRKELTEDTDTMPYIVIVIDELADIMQSYPRELEGAIVRLAQMSRATGIHLILSTQRPSVNVITGLIKANIPARVALQVSSQVDSRTILDMSGAETLLGAGDMLYLSSDMSKPKRLQSAFISEKEVKNIVSYLKKNYVESLPEDFELGADNNGHGGIEEALDGNFEDDDDLFEEAREIVIEAGKASTSYLQRKLRIGYARAARLMDILEERGVVGPPDGAKPRDVLVKSDEGYGEE